MPRQYRNPCPGPAGSGCPSGHHLRRDSVAGLCFSCRVANPNPRPRRPPAAARGEVLQLDVPEELAAVALSRIRPLCRPELRLVLAQELLDQLMLSCYQQGLVDGDQLSKRERAAS